MTRGTAYFAAPRDETPGAQIDAGIGKAFRGYGIGSPDKVGGRPWLHGFRRISEK